ncbi:zinc finger CCCH domain-containing protein 18 isoform X2 [Zophobas morio]|uniref:zinc finger CCCH domain-containing protein 18 isoform X2 n=1 Tax=Zophobas morio TaxID=2755281 RepID=UPI003082ACD8
MDSEDSREASSGNESDRKGPRSPSSSRSRSRNSQAGSVISRSASPQSGPESPRSPGARSALSRSSSPDSRSETHSRSRSRVKSPGNASSHSSPASRTRSPNSPDYHPKSPVNGDGPRSPSPANSSRSSSPGDPKSPVSNNEDKHSVKSASSRSSNKSISPDRVTNVSGGSGSSRGSRTAKRSDHEDGNTSDSSVASIDSSSRKNKNITKNVDTLPEEISDGDMESDHEKEVIVKEKEVKEVRREININHEDLSDVSDLDESIGGPSDDECDNKEDRKQNGETKKDDSELSIPEKSNRAEDGEEQLDFEAEDGECEMEDKKEKEDKDTGSIIEDGETADQREKERDELEEGEVTDEDEVRPEETEPRPVCRFFSRGQCTWGASCRFLHPGVTDKGNYTMFELIRPVVPGEYGREEKSYGRPEPAPMESAWERGLRTAKEMLRKSIKRKEQDIDFEEKKMNLSLAQEEFDKENGYYGRVASPEPRYVRHVPVEYPPVVRAPPPTEEYYGRRQVIYEPDYVAPPRERVRTYRELPSHRMPDYYNNKYEDEAAPTSTKARKPKREVIVQRAEERPVRGDEWSDPWMRSKSPAGRKSGRKRSYSSGSSYSSSSSSRSSSESSRSSFRSRSRSHNKRTARSHRSRHVSPSVIVSERKAANERAALMNPPAPRKRAPSPGMMRVSATNPPAPLKEDQFGRTRSKMAIAAALARVKGRRRSSKSSSDSSGSSSSDSDSSGSSSSSSREGSSPRRASGVDISIVKAMDALKGGAAEKRQIKLNLKNPVGVRKPEISDIARKTEALQGKKRPANSPPPIDPKSKKATSRREELLKQLKAVEDAIAKKRSKVN